MRKFVGALVIGLWVAGTAVAAKPDIDFSRFSSVMAYSGVFDILANPSAYEGKIIKLTGFFDVYHDEQTGIDYFGIIIMDEGACCGVGLDFVLRGEHTFPEDYPQVGSEITVCGKFNSYREGEDIFCRLVDAELL